MLVHKRTLGVLQWYWDGESYSTFNNETFPKLQPVTLKTYDLNPDDWWVIPNGEPLAREIIMHYPYFDPEVVDGELVGINIWPAWKVYGEEEPQQPVVVQRRRRKYNKRKSLLEA